MLNQIRPGRVAPRDHPERSPFSAGEWNRPLRLLIDDEEVEKCEALELLRALASRPSVEVYSTDGSTPYEARVEELKDGDPDTWAACLWQGDDFEWRFVGDPVGWRAEAEALVGNGADSVDSICHRFAIASFWSEQKYEAIVGGGQLFSAMAGRGRGLPMLKSPGLALAELGLCLRANGDYVLECGDGGVISQPNGFHTLAAVGQLDSYPRWRAAVQAAWTRGDGAEPYALIRSVAERLGRALRALDYVRVRRRHPRLEDSWTELLFFFDIVLLMLDGALDCLARLFHLVLKASSNVRQASWDKKEWRREVMELAPELGDDEVGLNRLVDVCKVVARLRNSVHGIVLSSEVHAWEGYAFTDDWGAGKLLITGEEASTLEAACRRLGLGALVEARPDSEVKPAVLIDADIFACAISREVMAAVEWLLGTIRLAHLPPAPPKFDLDVVLGLAGHRSNAALLAAIPPWGDSFSDTLDIGVAKRAYRRPG